MIGALDTLQISRLSYDDMTLRKNQTLLSGCCYAFLLARNY